MNTEPIKRGATSQLLFVFAQDLSSVVGAGKTGLTTSSFTSAWYARSDGTKAAITLDGTMAYGTWKTGGFVEVDSTHLPGLYQVGVPDAAFSATNNPTEVEFQFICTTASGAFIAARTIPLVAVDPQDAVHFGLSAVPNAAAGASGGLPTGDASGRVLLQPTQTGVTIPTTTAVTNGVTVATNNDKTGYALTSGEHTLISGTDVPTALNTAIPGSPTSNSVFDYIKNKLSQYAGGAVASVTGAVGSVTGSVGGDVAGKVLGGGASTITGTGARVVDGSGNAVAPASATTTIINAIGAFTGSSVNTILGFFRALMRSDLTAPSDVGGTFNPSTDSTQAISAKITAIPVSDPLSNPVPGSYPSGTAGYDIGQLPAIKAKTDTLGTTTVTTVSPLRANGDQDLVIGDSYYADDSRSIDPIITGQPSFIGATVTCNYTTQGGTTIVVSVTGSVLSATQLRFEPTPTQTAQLKAGIMRFEYLVVLSDGDPMRPVSLKEGTAYIAPKATP